MDARNSQFHVHVHVYMQLVVHELVSDAPHGAVRGVEWGLGSTFLFSSSPDMSQHCRAEKNSKKKQ